MLTTERLFIRLIEDEDWRDIKEIWDDFNKSDLRIYDNFKDTDPESLKPRIARWAQVSKESKDHMFFSVCHDGEMIGFYSFNIFGDGYEIGYGFKDKCQKKGYARESLIELVSYMKSLEIPVLYAGTAIKNTASVKLLESAGFELVCTEPVSFFKDEDGKDIVFEGGNFQLLLV